MSTPQKPFYFKCPFCKRKKAYQVCAEITWHKRLQTEAMIITCECDWCEAIWHEKVVKTEYDAIMAQVKD